MLKKARKQENVRNTEKSSMERDSRCVLSTSGSESETFKSPRTFVFPTSPSISTE